MAFVGQIGGVTVRRTGSACARRSVVASAEESMSRREALALIVGLGAGSIAQAAGARTGGLAFPKAGFNTPSLQPGDLELDQEILKSPEVQEKLKDLRSFRGRVAALADDFSKDGQMDVVTRVNNLVDVAVLRDDLNVVNDVFDEETQIKTDRVVRAVIQDLNDLKGVGALKEGLTRSDKKIENTLNRIVKLGSDIDKLLQFYPEA